MCQGRRRRGLARNSLSSVRRERKRRRRDLERKAGGVEDAVEEMGREEGIGTGLDTMAWIMWARGAGEARARARARALWKDGSEGDRDSDATATSVQAVLQTHTVQCKERRGCSKQRRLKSVMQRHRTAVTKTL